MKCKCREGISVESALDRCWRDYKNEPDGPQLSGAAPFTSYMSSGLFA